MSDSSGDQIDIIPAPRRSECEFYQSMDFPDGDSVIGAWDIRDGFDQYIGSYPIAGKTVLDVGTASGFLAFEAEKRGAHVTAIDALHPTEFERIPHAGSPYHLDRRAWAAENAKWFQGIKNGFWFARQKFASKVEMVYLPLAQLPFWVRRFDVVIAGAIIEHLANPVPVLADLAAMANEAVIIAFTPVDDTEEQTMRTLNDWSNPVYDFTWWILSRGLYRRVFSNVGFDVEFVVSVARHVASGEETRPTIIARRRASPTLEIFHTYSNARASLVEQQSGGGLRAIRFHTSQTRAHDDADAALRKRTLSFETPPGRWHYAISFDCNLISAGTAVELDVQVERGGVGFGFNDPTLSSYLSEEIFIRPEDGRKKIKIVLAETTPCAKLVVRNVSNDGKSEGTVFSIARV
jgi:SAM-dependent methyltransferase